MKYGIQVVFICLLLSGCLTKNNQPEGIEYDIRFHATNKPPVIQVAFDYNSDGDGFIILKYENNSWGDSDIFNCIKRFEVEPQPREITFERDSSLIIIKTTPNTTSTIHYQLVQDFIGQPLNKYRYRPIIESTYFHILGMRLFMVPEGLFKSESDKVNITFRFHGDLINGIFHSSFGKAPVQNINVTREDLYGSFFIGGDYRRYTFTHQKDTVYFVTRGNWKAFTDKDILNILKDAISSQYTFWNDAINGSFSVALTPTYESWYSVGGSGFASSFISFASNNDAVTLNHMKWLYNHELLHRWLGRTIKNENDTEQYWFSEGFTDYYAYKIMLKFGHLTVPEFINVVNKEVITPHYKDSLNHVSNARLSSEYWRYYSKYMKLPYRRGFLYAFYLDNQIKRKSQSTLSLDSLMHDFLMMALEDPEMRLSHSRFLSALSRYLPGETTGAEFERYILQGEPIDFRESLPEGLSIEDHLGIPLMHIDSTRLSLLEEELRR